MRLEGIATLSGGEGSWRSAKLWRMHNPGAPFRMLFTDTLYEDAGTYCFLLEGAADLMGRKLNWLPKPEDFPDYRVSEDVPLADYCGNPEWRAFLADLREKAAIAIPELIWLVEGRDPWEIFRDERFLGNSRVDPCSKIAKRQILERWRKDNCDPESSVFIFGIDEHERHRFDDGDGGGILHRWAAKGWQVVSPLIDYDGPHLAVCHAPVSRFGFTSQRLYGLGYKHGNCGGFCIKAGFAHWQNRHRVQPERYDYDAMMERKMRKFLGAANVTILAEVRRGGSKRPVSLDELSARIANSPELNFEYLPGESGCGCMLDEAA